jgi:hypothetical protein
MAMPETAVDENGDVVPGEHNIGLPRQFITCRFSESHA